MSQEQSPVLHPTGLLSWEKILRLPQHIDNAHIGILAGQVFTAHVGRKRMSGHFRQAIVDMECWCKRTQTHADPLLADH